MSITPFITENLLAFVLAFVVVSIPLSRKGELHPSKIKTMATSLGIGFTFIGIVIALSKLSIDTGNLERSLENLLTGLYTAFFSSIAGVIISISVELFPGFWKKEITQEDLEDETGIDAMILRELKELNKSIAGDNDGSLITRLEKLQLSVTENQEELKKAFDNFAEEMADQNMQALEEVIEEFNQQLQEQFGENFKRLDESVKKLLEWQENYKQIVKEHENELKQIKEVLENYEESMEESSKVISDISQEAESFENIAKELESQLEETAGAMSAISSLSENLSGRADQISEEMEEITQNSLQDLGEKLKAISETLVEDYSYIQEAIREIRDRQ